MNVSVGLLQMTGKSLVNRRMTAGLTVFAIAMSVMLFLGVNQLRDSARHSFEATLSGTDLIVGARSGEVNLLLYTLFRIGNPTNNLDWSSYREFAERPEVAWTIPISLGDAHRGYRVIGTNHDYFERYRYAGEQALEFAAGRRFEDLFDAVLGSEVAAQLGYSIGSELVLAHGIGATSFLHHDNMPFRVSGVLRPTGTPVDRAVHVSLQGLEAIHLGWESGAPNPVARRLAPDDVRALNLEPRSITAFVVGMQSRVMTLRMQREINQYPREALSAVLPGVALAQLWEIVGTAEAALRIIAGFVIALGLLGMLTSILTTLNERRREMAVLRAVGARPRHIFGLLICEAGILSTLGALFGLLLAYAAMTLLTPMLASRFGIFLTVGLPGAAEWQIVGAVVLLALLLGAIPAWLAYRRTLADGLTLQT